MTAQSGRGYKVVPSLSTLESVTRWGDIPVKHRYATHPKGATKLAVLFPGMGYTLDAPLMWYSERASFDAGCDVLSLEYGYQTNRKPFHPEDLHNLVEEAVAAVSQIVRGQYSSIVFIGKSLGTIVQAEVAQRMEASVSNHIFLTPLKRTIPFIQQSQRALVVVGDNDSAFSASEVSQISHISKVELVVIPKADHGLEVDDDIPGSIDVLKHVSSLCRDFCVGG